MATLHSALQSLGPTNFDSVPASSHDQLHEYVRDLFSKSQLIVESVPLPSAPDEPATARSRSNTTSSFASSSSEISSSSARSAPPIPAYGALQKEWGKPIKLGAKENALNMSVYKMGGKDGKGAWFARRSVHEGLGFAKFKKGLEREFPESLAVQGAPGQGNIRGIGGERVVERIPIPGLGKVEVYQLSAQFPGPTTPRDFVTMLITSAAAMKENPGDENDHTVGGPRHYMIISKPCIHPETPRRDDYIRGNYESVEFIREIPIAKKPASSGGTRANRSSTGATPPALLNTDQRAGTWHHDNRSESHLEVGRSSLEVPDNSVADSEAGGRKRGHTISYSEGRGEKAKGEAMDNPDYAEDPETNPVEWIMITRSDPGGSVPRFMVERGTPSSIVADAGKFLDWACQKEHFDDEDEETPAGDEAPIHAHPHRMDSFSAHQANGHLAGLGGSSSGSMHPIAEKEVDEPKPTVHLSPEAQGQGGIFANVTKTVSAGLGAYTPQVVLDQLGHTPEPSPSLAPTTENLPATGGTPDSKEDDASSVTSDLSFASADEHLDGETPTPSITSATSKTSPKDTKDVVLTPHEKELEKLEKRRQDLDAKLAATRDKANKDAESQTAKEKEAIKKAEEKHAKELAKQEEKYKKEVAKLEQRKQREAQKLEEKKKKQMDKDEKSRLTRERDEAKAEIEVLKQEREIWRQQVGELQKENTRLAAQLGKDRARSSGESLPMGTVDSKATAKEGHATSPIKEPIKDIFHAIKDGEGPGRLRAISLGQEGNRSRSGSVRKSKEGSNESGRSP